MSEAVREMTREELVAENRELRTKACELQKHIECLQEELKEVQKSIELPFAPIEVAELLINATYQCEHSELAQAFGEPKISTELMYSKSELKQIAEDLLVYVNNTEDLNGRERRKQTVH